MILFWFITLLSLGMAIVHVISIPLIFIYIIIIIHFLDEKVHMCDQCGRRFKLKSALSVHRKSHLNIRPHVCNVCQKSFVNHKDLQRHDLIHSGNKFAFLTRIVFI